MATLLHLQPFHQIKLMHTLSALNK
jgi:hypothetical protein